jgi:hypothetical protein
LAVGENVRAVSELDSSAVLSAMFEVLTEKAI